MAAAMKVEEGRPSFVHMFVIDFEDRTVKRLAKDENDAVVVIDEAFNEAIGRHSTVEQIEELAE